MNMEKYKWGRRSIGENGKVQVSTEKYRGVQRSIAEYRERYVSTEEYGSERQGIETRGTVFREENIKLWEKCSHKNEMTL